MIDNVVNNKIPEQNATINRIESPRNSGDSSKEVKEVITLIKVKINEYNNLHKILLNCEIMIKEDNLWHNNIILFTASIPKVFFK